MTGHIQNISWIEHRKDRDGRDIFIDKNTGKMLWSAASVLKHVLYYYGDYPW